MCDVGNIILNSVLTFASVWIVRKFLGLSEKVNSARKLKFHTED